MNPETPLTGYDASALGPGKRKRGRPRKHQMLEDQSPTFGEDAQIIRNLNLYARGKIHEPPGLQVNGNQPHSVGSILASNDLPIGQTVSGVIEASFDGGYLLVVRAGKSEPLMRGVVFKPGRYLPVSAENDIAPDIKMIKRSEVRLSAEKFSNLHASGGRSSEKNGVSYCPTSFPPPLLMSQGSKLLPSGSPPAMCQTPLRGNTVPVTPQPISPANGSIITNQTHTVGVQGARPSAIARLPPPAAIQGHHFQNGSAMPKAGVAEGDPNQSLGEGSQTCTPFENLVTEVIQRIHLPTQADGTQNESSKTGGKSSSTPEDDVSDGTDQPLFIEPLQTREPLLAGHTNIIPQQLDLGRTAKMTQLLQENAARNVFLQNQNKLE